MISLDILIPTFNRCQPLIRNLSVLEDIIAQIKNADINILVLDNASNDDTQKEVSKFISEHPQMPVRLYSQKGNIGFTNNLICCVGRSHGDFILILGDDDFLNERYIAEAIKSINNDVEITCVIPSFEGISEKGVRLGFGRDLELPTKLYEKGVSNVIQNSCKAHQLSGIILKREGLYESLLDKNITNLYPQIFMTAVSCLHGKCLQITDFPVLVTQTDKKAWKYDDVGLINDIFQNFHALDLDDKSQYLIERQLIKTQRWRALRYWKNPIKQLKVIRQIANGPYTSKRGRFLFPLILIYYWINTVFGAVQGKIKDSCR